MATYGRLEYLHPNNSFITEPLSDAYNLITFGRDPKCDIVLETPHIAAVQTKVYVDHSELWVCDAGPANGEPSLTRVNGKELGPNPQQLQPEDVIEVFNRRFRFVAEHTKKNVSMSASLEAAVEQIRDKPVSRVGPAVEEEPMNYLAERIKSVFGEEFYDRSFEQWCDYKQYGKAYATSSGPQRNNYDWVPGPDLAAIVPLMVENALTGAVELYLPLGSFVPKQPRKARRVARRTVKSEDLLPPASSKIAGDAPASGKNERETEKATKTKTTTRKKTIVMEEEEEVDHDEEEVYEEKRDRGEKEKEKKQKGRRTVAAVKGVKRTASKTAEVKEDEDEDDNEDYAVEAKPSSKGRSASATKAKAKVPPSKKYTRRKPVKEEDDDDEEEEASKAKEEEVNDDGDFAFNDNDDEVVKRKTTKKVNSTKRVARRTTKKTTTTKTKSRKASDDDGGDDEDYNDEASEEESVDIEGVTAEEDDDDDDDVDKENEYVAPKKKAAAKRTATRKNTTSAATKKASPPAESPVRRSGRATRSTTGPVTAKASGASLFRETKDRGKLVDPFSPTKSITKNYKEVYMKKKAQGTPQRGVVTRRKANATATDEPPAKPRGKLDL